VFKKFEPWVWLESAWAPGTKITGKSLHDLLLFSQLPAFSLSYYKHPAGTQLFRFIV
jgi:hypothetical protein